MAFLQKTDLALVILTDELDEITRADDTLVDSALLAAEAEARVFLYDSFDVDAIFSATGTNRHQMLVRLIADMAVYMLCARLQAGQDLDDRKARYDRAISFLKSIQKTESYADLPRRELTAQTHITTGSNTKRGNYY